jgi:hypothetical protein
MLRFAETPGVAETTLTQEQIASLPADAPPAPWRARARAVAWWARPDHRARAALSEALPSAPGTNVNPFLTIGAMISYGYTPVGPYSEVLVLVVLRSGARVFTHVPFIAVDSPASVVGGRENWALPKTLAAFEGVPRNQITMCAAGTGWSIRVTPRAYGPALPWLLPPIANLVQIGPGGDRVSARLRGRGTARLARVTIETAAASLADWFPTGRCSGAVSGNLAAGLPAASREQPPVSPLL